jgi:hypothetical protein
MIGSNRRRTRVPDVSKQKRTPPAQHQEYDGGDRDHSPKPIRRASAAAIRRPIFSRHRRQENIGFSVGRRRARCRQQISARAAARLEFKKILIKKNREILYNFFVSPLACYFCNPILKCYTTPLNFT